MKRWILGLLLLSLGGCGPAYKTDLTAAPYQRARAEIAELIARPETAELRAAGSDIQSLARVYTLMLETGHEQEALFVWSNPDTPGPQLDTLLEVTAWIYDDAVVFLRYAKWTEIPPPFVAAPPPATDFQYAGTVACPDTPDWHGLEDTSIALGPHGEAWIKSRTFVYSLRLPAPVPSKSFSHINEATVLETWDFPGLKASTSIGTEFRYGWMARVGDRLMVNAWEYYNTAGRDHVACGYYDGALGGLGGLGQIHGCWRAGPDNQKWDCADVPNLNCNRWIAPNDLEIFHSNKTGANNKSGGYAMPIPSAFSSVHLGPGVWIAAGGHRGNGAFGSGQGPQLYAIRADTPPAPGGDWGAVPLMAFPFNSHTWQPYRPDNVYTVVWADGCLVVFAMEGQGQAFYGPANGSCDPNKGWHSFPYRPRMYLIDEAVLGEVADGLRDPWNVQPYAEAETPWSWKHPDDPGQDPDCRWPFFAAAEYDPVTRSVLIVQTKAEQGSGHRTVIHTLRQK